MIVLFKNKVRKKILKTFVTYERALKYFNELKNKNDEIIFEKKINNGKESEFEIGIISLDGKSEFPIYLKDGFGRNIKVKLEDDKMNLMAIQPYKVEEKIHDIKLNKKITVEYLIKKYLSGSNIKMIYYLNNKIIIQDELNFSIFSLKNETECERFIDSLSKFFYINKKTNCLFIKDCSTPQKKYLYELLMTNGIDKKMLYRKYTTYPK